MPVHTHTHTHSHTRTHSHTHTLSLSLSLQVVIALGDYQDAMCHACIGGTNVRADITKLEMGQHIVVGTPGRVFDMIQRKALGECELTLTPVGRCLLPLVCTGSQLGVGFLAVIWL